MTPASDDHRLDELVAARPAYELYYRALSGRRAVIEAVDPRAASSFPDTYQTLRLPSQVDGRAGSDPRAWYRVALTHRALHHTAGTFAFSLDHGDERLQVLRARRGEGRSDLEIFLGSFGDRRLATQVFELLEDMRIDAILSRRYHGLAGDLRRIIRSELRARPAVESLPPRAAAVEALARVSLFGTPLLPPALTWLVDVVRRAAEPLVRPVASVEWAAAATVRIYAVVARLPNLGGLTEVGPVEPTRWPEDARVALEGDDVLRVSLARIGYRDELDGRLWQAAASPPNHQALYRLRAAAARATDAGGAAAAVVQADSRGPQGPPQPLPHERHEVAPELHVAAPGPLAATVPGSFVYPEWDCYLGGYRDRWCRVVEQRTPVGDARGVHNLQHDYARLLHGLRRLMREAAPEAYSVQRRARDGDDVDYDAAVEAVVDLRTGRPPSEAVYRRLRRRERDVAVALLVDVSSSTAERVAGSQPPRILDIELLSALLCMTALDAVGDAFAAWLFSGTGREHVAVSVLKGLDEPFTGRIVYRAAAVKPLHATRMGAAVRHATARMRAAPHATKVLIVLSDGRPHDIDYGTAYGEAESLAYAAADTGRALDEARAHGVRPFMLTVDSHGEEYLGETCTRDHEVLRDIGSLPERLTSLYRDLTVNERVARQPVRVIA
ncbi:MAG TPA: hypothetical protein VFA45_20375 [Actinomycetes bacterium]|jgi:hypothetical protein|nr:hypothetical protein [Actinomycetes bacterium]